MPARIAASDAVRDPLLEAMLDRFERGIDLAARAESFKAAANRRRRLQLRKIGEDLVHLTAAFDILKEKSS